MRRIAAALLAAWMLLAGGALAIGQEDALRRILEADPAMDGAGQVSFYPSAEADGAWVFLAADADVYSEGTLWYVDGTGAELLAGGGEFFSWELLQCTPQLMAYRTGRPEARRAHAFVLRHGRPQALTGAEKLVLLGAEHGCLYGMAQPENYDYVFLAVDDGGLCEVKAVPLRMEAFLEREGAREILEDIVSRSGCTPVSCLYRSTGVITLNFLRDGKPVHAYVWETDGGLSVSRGWEDEIVLFDGEGGMCSGVGLRVVSSVGV